MLNQPKDRIDRLLIQKYANLKTSNVEENKAIPAEKVLDAMQLMAQYQRTLIEAKEVKRKVQILQDKVEQSADLLRKLQAIKAV
jgi:hypothetical protein